MILSDPLGRDDEVETLNLTSDGRNISNDYLERLSFSSSLTSLTRRNSESIPSLTISISDPTITRLYISHFLSYWNSRVFEFGSVLFLASIFPGTILPLSVYALVRGFAAIVFSPAVGRYIDVGERLRVVRLSIVLQRLSVALSCAVFWLLAATHTKLARVVEYALFVVVCVLAAVEKLASVMNRIAVERDWVIVIAKDDERLLGALNSQMRRIDLLCKLIGPLFIGLIDGISTELAISLTFGMNLTSVFPEYYAIAKVYQMCPNLRKGSSDITSELSWAATTHLSQARTYFRKSIKNSIRALKLYFKHEAFKPSFACAMLYCTVLSFAGQMITYLLSVGYTSAHVAAARTISVAFEISATWLAPWLMSKIGPVRTGIWFVSWQISCLVIGVAVFCKATDAPMAAGLSLVVATILSRVGLWGFDLSTQIIIQEEVDTDDRGSFSSIEASFQNAFELCSYISTVIFSKPKHFEWPVLLSVTATCMAGAIYATYVRQRRGHLLHLTGCVYQKEKACGEREEHELESIT